MQSLALLIADDDWRKKEQLSQEYNLIPALLNEAQRHQGTQVTIDEYKKLLLLQVLNIYLFKGDVDELCENHLEGEYLP